MRPPNECPPSHSGKRVRSPALRNAVAIRAVATAGGSTRLRPASMNGKSKRSVAMPRSANASAIACILRCRIPAPAPCANTSAATAASGHCQISCAIEILLEKAYTPRLASTPACHNQAFSVTQLRADTRRFSPALERAGRACFDDQFSDVDL